MEVEEAGVVAVVRLLEEFDQRLINTLGLGSRFRRS
jgi:hypothetical protein